MKVEGIVGLKEEDFTALVLYSGLSQTGRMETGNPLVKRLVSNVIWGQKVPYKFTILFFSYI